MTKFAKGLANPFYKHGHAGLIIGGCISTASPKSLILLGFHGRK
jgi:hypothetical protein